MAPKRQKLLWQGDPPTEAGLRNTAPMGPGLFVIADTTGTGLTITLWRVTNKSPVQIDSLFVPDVYPASQPFSANHLWAHNDRGLAAFVYEDSSHTDSYVSTVRVVNGSLSIETWELPSRGTKTWGLFVSGDSKAVIPTLIGNATDAYGNLDTDYRDHYIYDADTHALLAVYNHMNGKDFRRNAGRTIGFPSYDRAVWANYSPTGSYGYYVVCDYSVDNLAYNDNRFTITCTSANREAVGILPTDTISFFRWDQVRFRDYGWTYNPGFLWAFSGTIDGTTRSAPFITWRNFPAPAGFFYNAFNITDAGSDMTGSVTADRYWEINGPTGVQAYMVVENPGTYGGEHFELHNTLTGAVLDTTPWVDNWYWWVNCGGNLLCPRSTSLPDEWWYLDVSNDSLALTTLLLPIDFDDPPPTEEYDFIWDSFSWGVWDGQLAIFPAYEEGGT